MNSVLILSLAASLAGASIAMQSGLNSQLGVLVKNPLIATTVAFMFSFIFTLIALLLVNNRVPSIDEIKEIPSYLWFTGSIFSALGVSTFFYLAPKIGIGSMMSYALSGQLIMAIIISHFGWFDLPIKEINLTKIMGIIVMITGVVLINSNG